MESFAPVGGFQLPVQRRLSRLYNDTKKSTDFVKEPVQAESDPETRAMHRKLRIQKDRLVSWGIEWSDPSQSAEIDESLSRAGLSEVVGSIMSTIKDILAEAEAMWRSSRRAADGSRSSSEKRPLLVQWDKGRFDDLLRDLASSIDTLYDLSRTRSTGIPRRMSKAAAASFKSSTDELLRPFESSRMQTPQHVDPQSLTFLAHGGPDGATPRREVVFMGKAAYAELTHAAPREPWAPLLLEYAPFDSIYATTGIMPPMARFEKLSAGLQQDSQRAPAAWTGLPRLLGYFEDMDYSRLGLVYRFPPSFNPVLPGPLPHTPRYSLPTLRSLVSAPDSEPALEAKFRLAHNLTNTVFDMHARGVTHGNLTDTNISFCHGPQPAAGDQVSSVDIRRPLVSSFDLFPQDDIPAQPSLWRHPVDPRGSQSSLLSQSIDERVVELYSLAMLLLSVGLWVKLEDVAPELAANSISQPLMNRLAVKCGSLYVKAVQACLLGRQEAASGKLAGEALLSSVQVRVSRYLEACCILDGVSGLEDRRTQEPRPTASSEARQHVDSPRAAEASSPYSGDRKVSAQEPAAATPRPLERVDAAEADADGEMPPDDSRGEALTASENAGAPTPKMRLYPNVPLAPDAVAKWNSFLMPQINHALRHFYRKHPESVEISLESVGPSPTRTQPTVLVVCTSVAKVRAILKKRFSELFDGTTGFSVKVCRGHVVRARRPADPVVDLAECAPQEGHDGSVALNPGYQPQPGNGASIGAWIGDRHLPPVSLGGLIMVDDKPYGMTVHHMLDDPERDVGRAGNLRSSARPGDGWPGGTRAADGEDRLLELSDSESEAYSETGTASDYDDDDDESDGGFEPGDIPGVEPGCGKGYIVTQPALDDVEDGFYPCPDTEDEDHIDTYRLGWIWASSGIRRRQVNGLVHEVDWALLEFAEGRLPADNCIPLAGSGRARRRERGAKAPDAGLLRPTAVAPSASLPGMEVQCIGRTSGLRAGHILPALTSVKIFGRASASHTYQVASAACAAWDVATGAPGDSGAWVVDRRHERLCGHVLAWSQRKQVAYICPMDVLLLDMAETLDAAEICLPGGKPVVCSRGGRAAEACKGQGGVADLAERLGLLSG